MRLSGVVQRLGHQVEPSHPCQQQQPVVQVFALDEHVNGQYQYEDRLSQRLYYRSRGIQQVGNSS